MTASIAVCHAENERMTCDMDSTAVNTKKIYIIYSVVALEMMENSKASHASSLCHREGSFGEQQANLSSELKPPISNACCGCFFAALDNNTIKSWCSCRVSFASYS